MFPAWAQDDSCSWRGNAAGWLLSDCPDIDGTASPALKQHLHDQDVRDMEFILRHKGYKTLESYYSLAHKPDERAVILHQGRQLYKLVSKLPAMEGKLERIFGERPGEQAMRHPPQVPRKDLLGQSKFKSALDVALQKASFIMDGEKYQECTRALQRSYELMAACMHKTLEACNKIGPLWSHAELDKMRFSARQYALAQNNLLKDARMCVRNLLIMVCGVMVGGFDEHAIMLETASEASKLAGCDINFIRQLCNGIKHFDVLNPSAAPKRNADSGLQPSGSDAVPQQPGFLPPSSSDAVPEQHSGLPQSGSEAVPEQDNGLAPSGSDAVPEQHNDLLPSGSDAVPEQHSGLLPSSSDAVPKQHSGLSASSLDAVPQQLGDSQPSSSDAVPQQFGGFQPAISSDAGAATDTSLLAQMYEIMMDVRRNQERHEIMLSLAFGQWMAEQTDAD
jgi:hypothetical protein